MTALAHGNPPVRSLASERGKERTYFNFLLGLPHDKGEISPSIIISQKILSGTIKREIQQSRPTKAAPKSAASKLSWWYSLIPVDENIKDDVLLNQTPWDLPDRVPGLSPLCNPPKPRHRSCYHCIYSFPSYKRDHTERSPCHSGVCAFCIAEYYPIVRTSTVCPSGLLSGLGSVPNFVHSDLSFNEHLPKSRSFLLSAERGLGWQNACKMQDRRLRNCRVVFRSG